MWEKGLGQSGATDIYIWLWEFDRFCLIKCFHSQCDAGASGHPLCFGRIHGDDVSVPFWAMQISDISRMSPLPSTISHDRRWLRLVLWRGIQFLYRWGWFIMTIPLFAIIPQHPTTNYISCWWLQMFLLEHLSPKVVFQTEGRTQTLTPIPSN